MQSVPRLCLWLGLLSGCAPSSADRGFDLAFAGQAQSGGGLPEDVLGLRVDAYLSLEEPPLASTGCVDLESDPNARQAVTLDLPITENVALLVRGYADGGCAGAVAWRGFAPAVKALGDTRVSIYVTRRGAWNPIRGTLDRGRAFATATRLQDGRVLIAGGFDQVISAESGRVRLQAACDALIFDPAQAEFTDVVPLAATCRGLHNAVQLPEGQVMLVGGSASATVDVQGATRPVVRAEVGGLQQTAEVFDPLSGRFTVVGPAESLRRAAAAVVLSGERVILLGGRTDQLRSSAIVVGQAGAWTIAPEELKAGRMGAEALLLGDRILLIGGNDVSAPDAEILDANLQSQIVSAEADLGLSGHRLLDLGSGQLLISGGISNTAGSKPIDALWRGGIVDVSLGLEADHLLSPRAYHTVQLVPGLSPSESGVVIQGGLDADLAPNRTAEWIVESGDHTALEPPEGLGSIGVAACGLPDGNSLFVGGLDIDVNGAVLSPAGQILAP